MWILCRAPAVVLVHLPTNTQHPISKNETNVFNYDSLLLWMRAVISQWNGFCLLCTRYHSNAARCFFSVRPSPFPLLSLFGGRTSLLFILKLWMAQWSNGDSLHDLLRYYGNRFHWTNSRRTGMIIILYRQPLRRYSLCLCSNDDNNNFQYCAIQNLFVICFVIWSNGLLLPYITDRRMRVRYRNYYKFHFNWVSFDII